MISKRQYETSLDKVYDRHLQFGVVPSPSDASIEAAVRFSDIPAGSPTMKLFHMDRRMKFPRDQFNNVMRDIHFDLEIVYGEFVDLFKASVDSSIRRAVQVDSLKSELGRYRELASDLKSMISDAVPYTAVFGDSFDDTNGVNRTNSNVDIDSDAGIVTLKRSAVGTNRIGMSHLYNAFSPSLRLYDVPPTSVLRNAPVHGHGFDNALIDHNVPWIQSITIEGYGGKMAADLDIPITPKDYGPIRISKVEIKPLNSSTTTIEAFVSADGNTFASFGQPILASSRAVVFHSPGADAKILRLRMTKTKNDEQQGGTFEYHYGADYIHVSRVSYAQAGSLYSSENTLTTGNTIRTVELETEQDTPDGTQIEYQVRVKGNTQSDWSPITPLDGVGPAPKKLNITTARKVSDDINLNAVEAVKATNGMKFYKIEDYPTGKDVDPRTARLYRGLNAWKLRQVKNTVRRTAKDVFINFNFQSPDGRQSLYTYRSDDATVVSTGELLSDSTRPQALIRVPHKIDYNRASMTTIPTERGDHFDHEPNYSVASVVKSVSGQPTGYTRIQSEVEGTRMNYQANTLDRYHTKSLLKLNSLATAELTENTVANTTFIQTNTEIDGLKMFSYTDASNPERVVLMRKTVGTAGDSGSDQFFILGEYVVNKNGAITYGKETVPGTTTEIITEEGNQLVKLKAGRLWSPDFDTDMFDDASSFLGVMETNKDIDIYVMYASLAGNPVSLNTGSQSDGYLLLPTLNHYELDPNMFKDMVLPASVYISTMDGTVSGHFAVNAITKAPVVRTNADGTTDTVQIDALLIDHVSVRGGSIPPAEEFEVGTWYISYSDVTQYVEAIDNNLIKFKTPFEISRGDKIVVTYRAQFGGKLRVLEETVVVTAEPGKRGVEYVLDQDYRIDPSNGTMNMVRNGAINMGTAGRAYVFMEYEEEISDIYSLSSWMFCPHDKPVELNIARFGGYVSETATDRTKELHDITLDDAAGERIVLAGQNGTEVVDKSSVTKVVQGWYHVTVRAKDMSRARDILTALDAEGGSVLTLGNYFSDMRAYKDPLKYLHPDSFYDANRLGTHKYFTIDPSYGIIIPFDPGSNALLNNRLYDVYKGEILAGVFEGNLVKTPQDMPTILERFRLEYAYTPTVAGFAADTAIDASVFSGNGMLPATQGRYLIDTIELKAVMSRTPGQTADRTPVLMGYKLLIEA